MIRNGILIAGGTLSAAAALAHLAVIVGGPRWHRFFGAGEGFARAAERGELRPAIITLFVAGILAIWAAYAFSGAGLIRPLPLLRTALVAISAIYVARGLVIFFPQMLGRPDLSSTFLLWSSLIVLTIGLLYAFGTLQAWSSLSQGTTN